MVAIAGINPAARYILEIHWSSPTYAQESCLLMRREIAGRGLLRISEVRAHTFKVSIKPLNREGEELAGLPFMGKGRVIERFAGVYLDGVEVARAEPPQFTPMNVEAELVP
ncbi:MAG: hypothetical protein QXL31_05980 [Thermosphaera sp.]